MHTNNANAHKTTHVRDIVADKKRFMYAIFILALAVTDIRFRCVNDVGKQFFALFCWSFVWFCVFFLLLLVGYIYGFRHILHITTIHFRHSLMKTIMFYVCPLCWAPQWPKNMFFNLLEGRKLIRQLLDCLKFNWFGSI